MAFFSDNVFRYANYLIKYAQYKNVSGRNGFYMKSYPRISWEKFGSDDYYVKLLWDLSCICVNSTNTNNWDGLFTTYSTRYLLTYSAQCSLYRPSCVKQPAGHCCNLLYLLYKYWALCCHV